MESPSTLRAVGKVEVPVTVKLGEMTLPLEEVLELRPGATLRFPQTADGPAALEVDAAPIGEGEVVERDGRLGFRLKVLAGVPREGGAGAAEGSGKPRSSPPPEKGVGPREPYGTTTRREDDSRPLHSGSEEGLAIDDAPRDPHEQDPNQA